MGFSIIFLTLKSIYFFRFFGEIAPLVEIIAVIFNDILYFMIIYGITMFGFIIAYYQLGRNQFQLEYQKLKDEDPGKSVDYNIPPYATALGAVIHVYISSLGEFDIDSYLDSPMEVPLLILFLGLSFFMCIHMLNMLIAIMGDSFERNN